MLKQISRSEGFRLIHIFQICVAVAVFIWVLHQTKLSYGKNKAFTVRKQNSTNTDERQTEISKLGRKDLPHTANITNPATEASEEDREYKEHEERKQHEYQPKTSTLGRKDILLAVYKRNSVTVIREEEEHLDEYEGPAEVCEEDEEEEEYEGPVAEDYETDDGYSRHTSNGEQGNEKESNKYVWHPPPSFYDAIVVNGHQVRPDYEGHTGYDAAVGPAEYRGKKYVWHSPPSNYDPAIIDGHVVRSDYEGLTAYDATSGRKYFPVVPQKTREDYTDIGSNESEYTDDNNQEYEVGSQEARERTLIGDDILSVVVLGTRATEYKSDARKSDEGQSELENMADGMLDKSVVELKDVSKGDDAGWLIGEIGTVTNSSLTMNWTASDDGSCSNSTSVQYNHQTKLQINLTPSTVSTHQAEMQNNMTVVDAESNGKPLENKTLSLELVPDWNVTPEYSPRR